TILFFKAPRAILQTQPAAGVKAAIISGAAVEVVEKGTIGRDCDAAINPERHGRNRCLLVRQAGPPALGSDVVGHRIGAPYPSELRIRLGAPERHGKRCTSA